MLDRIDRYKAALDAVRPFGGDTLKELRDYYKIGLTWSSNALEGNTLTISETKVVLEDGLTVGGRPFQGVVQLLQVKPILRALEVLGGAGVRNQIHNGRTAVL